MSPTHIGVAEQNGYSEVWNQANSGWKEMAVYAMPWVASILFLTVDNQSKQCLQQCLAPYANGSVRLYLKHSGALK